jgi:hypothetical protein
MSEPVTTAAALRDPDPARVRLVAFDSDGTLTDRGIAWDTDGRGSRRFDVRDGIAMQWAQHVGVAVVVISGKDSRAVSAPPGRARRPGIPGREGQGGVPGRLREEARHRARRVRVPRRRPARPACAARGALPDGGRGCASARAQRSACGRARRRAVSVPRADALEHVFTARGVWGDVLARYSARDLVTAIADDPSARRARRFE